MLAGWENRTANLGRSLRVEEIAEANVTVRGHTDCDKIAQIHRRMVMASVLNMCSGIARTETV